MAIQLKLLNFSLATSANGKSGFILTFSIDEQNSEISTDYDVVVGEHSFAPRMPSTDGIQDF